MTEKSRRRITTKRPGPEKLRRQKRPSVHEDARACIARLEKDGLVPKARRDVLMPYSPAGISRTARRRALAQGRSLSREPRFVGKTWALRRGKASRINPLWSSGAERKRCAATGCACGRWAQRGWKKNLKAMRSLQVELARPLQELAIPLQKLAKQLQEMAWLLQHSRARGLPQATSSPSESPRRGKASK